MAFVLAAKAASRQKSTLNGIQSISLKAYGSRFNNMTYTSLACYEQRREISIASLKQKAHCIKEKNVLLMTNINNSALKYGLFGVAVGNPSSWVVSLISMLNGYGVPWWGAIASVALGFRVALLPFSIKAARQSQKMQEIQPELNKLMERSKLSQSMGLASESSIIRDEMMDLYARAGVSPMGPMVGSIIQLPVVMSCFFGIRKVCETVPALTEGGALWFMNLTIPDPMFILPVIASLSTLFMTELGADGMNTNGQIGPKYLMRGMSIATLFIASKMPAGLCIYWIINSAFAGIQTICINKKARNKLLRWVTFSKRREMIPPPPQELPMKGKLRYDNLIKDVKTGFVDSSK